MSANAGASNAGNSNAGNSNAGNSNAGASNAAALAPAPTLLTRLAGLPDWARVLLIYAATRLFSGAVIARVSDWQVPNQWTTADPGYLDMTVLWDGGWYRTIAEQGYPDEIPRDPTTGAAQQNAWAFYPLFPLMVRWLTGVTGTSFVEGAGLVALVTGALAVVVMHRLLREVAGPRIALGGVTLFCCFPAAPVLQLAYTESLATLLLVTSLLLLVTRRYLWAIPVVLAVGLARPIALPLAGVVGVHLLLRWWWHRIGREDLPAGDAVKILLLGAVTFAAGWFWPVVVWWRTGQRDGYTETMATWRVAGEVVPLKPWWDVSQFVLGDVLGPLTVLAVGVGLVVAVLSPAGRRVGPDLQAWTLVYAAYLLVVLDPWTSLPRYVLLAFPLFAIAVAASRSRAYLTALVVTGLLGQVVWIAWLLRFVPPSDLPP